MAPSRTRTPACASPGKRGDVMGETLTPGRSSKRARTPVGQNASLSDIWLLRARQFDGDVRSKEATELKAYLVPEKTYVVGTNAGAVDILVKEDRTVSRMHARLRVMNESKGAGLTPGCQSAYVEVTDTSSHGRTYVSGDMQKVLKAEKIRDLAGCDAAGASAKAYHGYYMMLGQMSPFRLTRVALEVCLSGTVGQGVEKVVAALGVRVVEAEKMSCARSNAGGVCTRMVVGGEVVEVGDDVLLAMVVGVPVVTGGWVRAWVDAGRTVTSAPREGDFGVTVVGRHGEKVETSAFERRKVMEGLSGVLGPYRLGGVRGDVTGAMVAAGKGLGLAFDVLERREDIEGWVLGCVEAKQAPMMVLKKRGDVRLLPQPACAYCLVEDLRFAMLDGEGIGLVRSVGRTNVREMTEGELEGGWHEVDGGGPLGSLAAEDTDIEEDREQHPIYTTEAPVIDKKEGFKSKRFKKKHRVPDAASREIVAVVGDRRSRHQDDKAWVEIERERQAMMDAFDRQGLVIGPKKRAPRR